MALFVKFISESRGNYKNPFEVKLALLALALDFSQTTYDQ
jgi:hypothetical protein